MFKPRTIACKNTLMTMKQTTRGRAPMTDNHIFGGDFVLDSGGSAVNP